MRKVREVLRLKWGMGLSGRKIADSLNVGRESVKNYTGRAKVAGLSWPLPEDLGDVELEAMLYPLEAGQKVDDRAVPDWSEVHKELKAKKRTGVTLKLLWHEYLEVHPDGYGYSRFCDLYRKWRGTIDVEMRQEYKAGEKLFVDYAGQTVPVVDRQTGEVRDAEVFVGSSGASNYLYAEATWTQTLPDWIGSHVRLFDYMGGVHEMVIPDQLKSGVTKACRYDPDLNRTYAEMAEHYGTAVIPARPGEPRDKAKVEEGVQCVERWCLAPLRHRTFFSLKEVNHALWECLEALNARPFQKLPGSRKSVFDEMERHLLKPLPEVPYEFATWKIARVNVDYHVQIDRHSYSAPYQLVKQSVWVRQTSKTVEIFHNAKRIASHLRSYRNCGFTTLDEHMPKNHREYKDWSPDRLIRWAQKTGPNTAALVEEILATRIHPVQGYRACFGIMRLEPLYGRDRLEAACLRALSTGCRTYRSVESILKNNLDKVPLKPPPSPEPVINHDHVRGAEYYDEGPVDA